MATPIPSRTINRAASKPGRRGAKPPATLLAAADAGILTRSNTEPGTRGRQAVDRVTYLRRTSPLRRRQGETVAEQAGHARPEVQGAAQVSALFDRADPWTVLEAPTRSDKRRAGRYASLQGQLAAGQISPRQFQRRVSGWAPIRGERFLSDPDRVLAILEARRAAGDDLFVYVSGRAA